MISIVWKEALGHYDVEWNGGLVADDTLRTPVLISLMSDALAPAHTGLKGAERRGWWAWSPTEPEGEWGSRIWLLMRSPLTDQSATLLREYVELALAWLVKRKIAKSVVATTKQSSRDSLELALVITRSDGSDWSAIWKLTTEGLELSGGVQSS